MGSKFFGPKSLFVALTVALVAAACINFGLGIW